MVLLMPSADHAHWFIAFVTLTSAGKAPVSQTTHIQLTVPVLVVTGACAVEATPTMHASALANHHVSISINLSLHVFYVQGALG